MSNKHITFGTDGIRGRADEYPFTNQALFYLGIAIAQWGNEKYMSKPLRVLLGHDTRLSCDRIKKALARGLLNGNIELIDAGEIPTPAVLNLMHHDGNFDFGVIISASHNPHDDNGIKLFNKVSGKLTFEDEVLITRYFSDIVSEVEEPVQQGPDRVLTDLSSDYLAGHTLWPQASHEYVTSMLEHFPPNIFTGITVVLDCAHGATYQSAPLVFSLLGATVIPLHVSPSGININEQCGALYPAMLQEKVRQTGADIGFAFDGDGDRVLAVTKYGDIKDGDDLLCLLLSHPRYAAIKTIVGTVMTNYGFERYLQKQNKNLLRVKVGDKYIVNALDMHNLSLGGETSGHLILNDYLPTGDGIFVALRALETMMLTQNWYCATFEKYPQVLVNVPVKNTHDLTMEPYASVIDQQRKNVHNGRIVVRYSGTEPLLRVMVEDQEYHQAHKIAHALADQLRLALE